MRKRDRTGYRPVFADGAGDGSSADPWAGIPEEFRKTVKTTLPSGAILTTYLDVIGEAPRLPRRAPSEPLAAPAGVSPNPAPAAPVANPLSGPNVWSRLDETGPDEEARP